MGRRRGPGGHGHGRRRPGAGEGRPRGPGCPPLACSPAPSLTHLGQRGGVPSPASFARVPAQPRRPAPTAPVFTSDARPPRSRTCYLGPPPPAPPPKHWRGRERAGAEGATAVLTNHSPSCVLAHALIGSPSDRPSSNGCRPGAFCRDFPLRQARWSQRESGGEGRGHGG